MSRWRRELYALYGFVERQFNLTRRYLGWEIVWLAYSIANALSIAYIAPGMARLSGKELEMEQTILYLVIGSTLWSYISILFDEVSETVSWERWEGTIEYTFLAPISRITHLGGMCLFAMLYGMLHSGLILGTVALFFKIDLSGANLGGALLVLMAASLSLVGLGIVAAIFPLISPAKGSQMVHIIQAVLLLVSGVYYPVEVLPEWLQYVSRISPATYTLKGARQALLLGVPTDQLLVYIKPLLLLGIVAIPLGLLVFHRAEQYAKRTGKLKRSG